MISVFLSNAFKQAYEKTFLKMDQKAQVSKIFEIMIGRKYEKGRIVAIKRLMNGGMSKELIFLLLEKDLSMMQEILSQIKEKIMREDIKNGMSLEKSLQEFEENNHTKTMEEFAENVGAKSPQEAFEAEMQERFGEDYEKQIDPKEKSAGVEQKKADDLADIINFKEKAEKLNTDKAAEIQFVYDEKLGTPQILDETETHVKVGIKGIEKENNEWSFAWILKDSISPPLEKDAGENGIRTASLKKDSKIVVEDPIGKEKPISVKAEELSYRKDQDMGVFVAEGFGHKGAAVRQEQKEFHIWIDKKDIQDAYGGKALLISLKADKEYKLYSAESCGRDDEGRGAFS